jgi:ElaB/YqjD/DUF883 family membrane-anchored ribosome-binding protein
MITQSSGVRSLFSPAHSRISNDHRKEECHMADTALKPNANERAEIDQLKSDLKTLREDFTKLGKDAVSATRHTAGSASEAAKAEARKRLDQLGDAWDSTKEQGAAAKHDVERRIEEHPLASVMIALGVGFVIGKLIDRR